MPDIYEIYTTIRTYWFSFGLMDSYSSHLISSLESTPKEQKPDMFSDHPDLTKEHLIKEPIFSRVIKNFGNMFYTPKYISY
jgi:hypothetical protein